MDFKCIFIRFSRFWHEHPICSSPSFWYNSIGYLGMYCLDKAIYFPYATFIILSVFKWNDALP